jgi:hypothetical protein
MSNTNEALQFKVGDKVRLKAHRMAGHPEAFHGRLIVDDTRLGNHIGVETEEGIIGGFFPSELEADRFREGDRVVSPEYAGVGRTFNGELIVDKMWEDGDITCKNAEGIKGIFSAEELRFAPEVIAVEQEPEPQPVTYRICVDNQIGTTEYPSQAAAEQAAILHGNDGETFSIWETVMVADYRVKVTKSLESVDAAD